MPFPPVLVIFFFGLYLSPVEFHLLLTSTPAENEIITYSNSPPVGVFLGGRPGVFALPHSTSFCPRSTQTLAFHFPFVLVSRLVHSTWDPIFSWGLPPIQPPSSPPKMCCTSFLISFAVFPVRGLLLSNRCATGHAGFLKTGVVILASLRVRPPQISSTAVAD